MTFDDLLNGVGQAIGVPLQNTEGACAIGVDDMQITLQYLEEVGQVSTFGEIGEPPPQGLEQLLSAMLNANHLFMGTGGSTISRDPESGKFFLCRYDSLALISVEDFVGIIEKFVNVLETWRRLVDDYRPVESSAQETLPAGSKFPGDDGFLAV